MRSDYIDRKTAQAVFSRMQPVNRLICEICANTGLRIDDVCALRTRDVKQAKQKSGWFVLTEQKTGKRKKLRLRYKDIDRMLWQAGSVYVFPNRDNETKHRTRQTVWRDLARSAKPLRQQGLVISPHSLRKLYAVEQFDKHGDLAKVQRQLNHDNINTTLLYVMSRELQKTKTSKKSNAARGCKPAAAVVSLKKKIER